MKNKFVKIICFLSIIYFLFPVNLYACNVWFTYEESNLPYVFNKLPSTNAYSPYDQYMASRWNLYADIFEVYSERQTQEYDNDQNDQVDPFLDDAGFYSYFKDTQGWGTGAAKTYLETCLFWCLSHDTSDIAYNSSVTWTTDIHSVINICVLIRNVVSWRHEKTHDTRRRFDGTWPPG